MATEPADTRMLQKLDSELKDTLDQLSADLNRVEILAGALAGFSRSVPDYEPRFHHVDQVSLRKHELHR